MWKTALLSSIRVHRASAISLIVLAVLSSTMLAYVAVDQNSFACAPNLILFPEASHLFGRTFYLAPPGVAKICLTIQFYGSPPGNLDLTPGLDLYHHGASGFGWSDCSYTGTNCGGATVSSSPESDPRPFSPMHVVWTINAPIGSKPGEYLLQYGLCGGGGLIGLSIGELNPTFRIHIPPPLCPIWVFGVDVTFDGYTGLVPTNQDAGLPFPIF